MEITVTDIPKCIKSFVFSPRTILSERTTVEFLINMKEYIFGNACCRAADTIGINVFDLVFVGERSFDECYEFYVNKVREKEKDIIKTALLLKKMYNGERIRISSVMCENGKAYIKEPENAYLNILNDDIKFEKKIKKVHNGKNDLELDKHARIILESVRLSAVKYGMKNTIDYKELIDKYNFRRFSTNLRLNNRPATVEEVNRALANDKNKILTDLSNPKNRVNFSVLFAIAYGGFTLSDLYSKNTVFDITSFDKEKKLSDLAGDLINIVYNGNGIEIANMFLHIISVFSQTPFIPVDMKNLAMVMDNYAMYYAMASLAAVCENIFKYDSMNGQMKQYLKKHTIENYWTSMDRFMMMKQYSVVITFCYKLAHFDPNLYREDPEYQGEILYAFECAEKFSRDVKKYCQNVSSVQETAEPKGPALSGSAAVVKK